jgi:hypothetical protein
VHPYRPLLRRLLVLVLVLVAALSGCGDERAGDQGPGTVAIVVAHHANELAPSLGEPQLGALRAAALDPDSDDAAAYVVAAGRPDVEVVDLEPRRPNGRIERGPRIDVLVDERLTALQQAVTRAAEQGTDVDLLRALGVAATTDAATVVVLTSGLSTTDPLDMRVTGWDRDPADLARDLREQRLLPELAGRTVVISGLGRTAGAQPALGLRELARLRDLWTAVCEAAGGSCRVDESVRPALSPVSRLTPPVVPVPAVTTARAPDGVERVEVPASVLFAPDSCALTDPATARTDLAPVADRLASGAFAISISGRTAPVGPGDGVELATCRARAAAELLQQLGVPAHAIAEVRGDGTLLDPPDAALDESGRPDPTRLAALRRVVFILVPQEVTR